MRDYRWFKILVRAFGLLLIGQSIPSIGTITHYVIAILGGAPAPTGHYWQALATYGTATVAALLLGLYMLSGAPKFVRYCIEQVEDRCIRCDYDIRGLTGQCPECGLPVPTPSSPSQP
jgi:hypothetical protein